jgi:hypothetical protein
VPEPAGEHRVIEPLDGAGDGAQVSGSVSRAASPTTSGSDETFDDQAHRRP